MCPRFPTKKGETLKSCPFISLPKGKEFGLHFIQCRLYRDILKRYDIFCLRTFLALADSEFDSLAFSQGFET
jgi:hypothetical protein